MKNTTRLKKPQVPKIGELLSFDDLHDRPKYAGQEMTSETSIPSFETIRDDAHSMVVAEAEARTNADADLQEQIDAIVASSDVRDIVGTYAELEAYDTSKLGDKDIIKVLADETHDDAESYYRWSTSAEEFSYIGSVGPYYTQAETDSLIGEKQDILTAGDNVTISAENEISATDTTYSNFIGTDGTTAGKAGLVPAPATADTGKCLKADGTWGTVQAGPTVVQTTGTSTTDVMSQDATTSMVYADPGSKTQVRIGVNASVGATSGVGGIAIGVGANVQHKGSVALGYGASTNTTGEVSIRASLTSFGHNNTVYRLLTGVHDPEAAHDAATKGYVDTLVGDIETALHAINNGGNA